MTFLWLGREDPYTVIDPAHILSLMADGGHQSNPGALGNGAGGEQGNVGIRPKASFLEDILCTKFGAFSASMLSLSDSKKH